MRWLGNLTLASHKVEQPSTSSGSKVLELELTYAGYVNVHLGCGGIYNVSDHLQLLPIFAQSCFLPDMKKLDMQILVILIPSWWA